jgi:phosphoserine phosphatase
MTQDEIIEMARQAGATEIGHKPTAFHFYLENLEAFAKLVAAKERKEICRTVQQIVPITSWAHELLDAIRARGNT